MPIKTAIYRHKTTFDSTRPIMSSIDIWWPRIIPNPELGKMTALLSQAFQFCLLATFLTGTTGDPAGDLAAVQRDFFQWHLRQAPEFSTDVGNATYNDVLGDLSLQALDSDHADVQALLTRARAIPRGQLSRQQRYSLAVLVDTLDTFVSGYRWKHYGPLSPVNFMDAWYLDLEYVVDVTPFKTSKDFENFISRLEARPREVRQMIELMTLAIRLGTTYHIVSTRDIPDQIADVIAQDPADSLLYKPFLTTLDTLGLSHAARADIRARGLGALRLVWAALDRLSTFIHQTYNKHTRATYGVAGLPDGGSYYRACLRWHLSVDTSPGAVHALGLREVARITSNMHKVMERQGFRGTVSDFYSKLKADPQFKLGSGEEILKRYDDIINNRIYPKLPQLFKNIPDDKVVVKALPYDGVVGSYLEGSADGTRPGTFFANVLRPNETNTFSMMALSLHEAVPGHHMQNIYQIAAGLPDFMRFIEYSKYYAVPNHFPFYTAYTEGWGLYSEFLGEEMGVYKDDFELMGRYGEEMLRAGRLVVDTGLHHLGWPRQKAVDYMAARTPFPMSDIEFEIDRYITWPGQACAYKVGEIKIKELRKAAEDALGPRFDIRAFHSVLLDNGPVPLGVLETVVNDYIRDVGLKQ